MNYESKFVNLTREKELDDPLVTFRLKQAEFTEQAGDVLFLSSKYPNAVLEGKKLSGEPEKDEDSCYNRYYFTDHAKEQFKKTKKFSENAGLHFLYFFYVTFGRGRAANFYVVPAERFEEDMKHPEETVSISIQKLKWFQLESPWFKNLDS